MVISQNQFSTWLEDPVTQALRIQLKEWVEERKEQWAQGELMGDTEFRNAVIQSRAIGNIETLNHVLDWAPDIVVTPPTA